MIVPTLAPIDSSDLARESSADDDRTRTIRSLSRSNFEKNSRTPFELYRSGISTCTSLRSSNVSPVLGPTAKYRVPRTTSRGCVLELRLVRRGLTPFELMNTIQSTGP